MGLIAVATAWSGFQATNWGGKMANSYALASAARTNAVEASLTGPPVSSLDIQNIHELG
jgi:hypothetical protein